MQTFLGTENGVSSGYANISDSTRFSKQRSSHWFSDMSDDQRSSRPDEGNILCNTNSSHWWQSKSLNSLTSTLVFKRDSLEQCACWDSASSDNTNILRNTNASNRGMMKGNGFGSIVRTNHPSGFRDAVNVGHVEAVPEEKRAVKEIADGHGPVPLLIRKRKWRGNGVTEWIHEIDQRKSVRTANFSILEHSCF
jgi:hypothetical protein